MNKLKTILGILVMIVGVLGSIYLGLWVCIIGGIWTIIQILTGAVAGSLGMVGAAVLKIIFGGTIGAISAFLSVLIGSAVIEL